MVEARLEIGTGIDSFTPFEDGATLDLVSGCQGSQHVWVALRTWGLSPMGTVLDVELVRDRDGMRVSQVFRVRVSLTPSGELAQVSGLTLVVPEPDQAIGEDLTLRATVTARDGASVTGERPVRIQWGMGSGCGGGKSG